ncbi:PilZ domain-containing protein [Oleidesulfovibrio sp.]|uniref:PilZ domain-containing protein n=1 Tax=Oleidesulfovibrio sp. TaxID=2909707 RepID=UPI003A89B0ED
MSGELDLVFTGSGGQRQAFRTRIKGLEAFLEGRGLFLPVRDISGNGCSVDAEGQDFVVGDDFQVDLYVNKKLFLAGLAATVVRRLPDGALGCSFDRLDRRQEARLDKLILEVQKRQIATKKASVCDEELEK